MKRGDVVRPVVTIAGLDARRQYTVAHVEQPSPFYALAYLLDASGALMPAPVENAHLVLEKVQGPATTKPSTALFN